ncbi:DUF1214 domain-containing protein [Vibrio chagasii]|nr:DUF1214 domain-containing protein [Vibrio chagasii]
MKKNGDGSNHYTLSPNAPKGNMENNWVQTTEGKGFNNIIFRMYSPT